MAIVAIAIIVGGASYIVIQTNRDNLFRAYEMHVDLGSAQTLIVEQENGDSRLYLHARANLLATVHRKCQHARSRMSAAERPGCIIVGCDVDTDELAAFHQEAKGLGAPAFIAIGAEQASTIPWITSFPKPFLSAELLAALERIRLGSGQLSPQARDELLERRDYG